jgi:hypothetical protein
MNFRRGLPFLLSMVAGVAHVPGGTGDPFGYFTLTRPARSSGLLGLPMVEGYRHLGTATAVGTDFIEFGDPLAASMLGTAGSGFIEVREGIHAGLTLQATGINGHRIFLNRPTVDLVSPGDTVGIRPNFTIGAIFGADNFAELLEGEDPGSADTLGIWDAATQSSRVYYFKTGAGWREAGNEATGDQSGAVIPYPTALNFIRRGTTPLEVVVAGAAPMPLTQQILPVWPGRNLLSGPYASAPRIDEWGLRSPLFPILAGPSAPRSDTLRLTYADGSSSQVVYFRENHGWLAVGRPEDAADTRVEFFQAIDLNRAGPAGYIRFAGVLPTEASALRTLPPATVPIQKLGTTAEGVRIEWASTAGTTYRIQARATGQAAWSDLGDAVVADGPLCHAFRQPEGNGILRILVAP